VAAWLASPFRLAGHQVPAAPFKDHAVGLQRDEFPATVVCQPLFGGAANLDEITFPTKAFTGLTLRLFDPAREEWSLNWVSSRTGLLQPPMLGRFGDNGRGRWEQAFCTDGGRNWESNWVMEFARSSRAGGERVTDSLTSVAAGLAGAGRPAAKRRLLGLVKCGRW
jgi:hypothetical protein